MKMHLAAFYQSVNSAAGYAALNAVPDVAVYTQGGNIRVPPDIANLLAEAALSAQTSPFSAQIQSPSLRELANQDIGPIAPALLFSSDTQLQWHGDNPRALQGNEALTASVFATGGAAAGNYVLAWLADGAVKPSPGKQFTMRLTAAAVLSAGLWVNSPLTFGSSLPAGSYQVVGMRAEGAHLVAARLVFIGGAYRPGVPAEPTASSAYFSNFRDGAYGVLGEFDINQPPTVDCLGATDTTQVIYLDLIKSK